MRIWTELDKIHTFLSNFVQYFAGLIFINLLFSNSYKMSRLNRWTFAQQGELIHVKHTLLYHE